MKKILVVLLILAVAAGGVFAQGSWSIGARAEFGAYLNFIGGDNGPTNSEGDDAAGVMGIAYWTPGGYDQPMAELYLNYNYEGLTTGLNFSTDEGIAASLSFSGENYNFVAEKGLSNLFNGTSSSDVDRLWGNYTMLNGMMLLEAAMKSQDTNFWNSAETVGEVFDWDYGFGFGSQGYGWGFASVDGHNYILADFSFSGLNFGVMIPNVFPYGGIAGGKNPASGYGDPNDPPANLEDGWPGHWGIGAPAGWGPPPFRYNSFVEDCLEKLVFGISFNMQPIDVAMQFNLANYGAYIGANASFGAVTASLSFEGTFDSDADQTIAGFAAGLEFNPGAFSAYLKGGVHMLNDDNDVPMVIGIRPGFSFNVIPSHMAITLDSGFWFQRDEDFLWAFVPQLWWNFKGDGAFNSYYSRYVGPNYDGQWTGMVVRFIMAKDEARSLDVVFRWGMY